MKHKPLARQLTAQFFRGNVPMFALAVFAALTGGTLNLIVTWLMQQLIDAASGLPGALPLGQLAQITGGFILLCAALMLLKYASEPRFIEKAMRQYKDFAFQKLTEKSISSFRAESTAAYLSALTIDAASIEADDLSQLLSVITKAVTFFGALAMMLWYSPLMTAIAAGVTVLPLIASVLTGGQLQAAEKRVSDRNRDFTAALSDCLGGFSVVKTFRAEKEIFRLFAESNRALEQEKFSRRRVKALVGMIGATTGIIAQLGVFLAGAYLALSGKGLTAGAVILFVNLMNFMIEPVAELPALLAARKAARGLIDKLADALEQDETQPDGMQIAPLTRQLRLMFQSLQTYILILPALWYAPPVTVHQVCEPLPLRGCGKFALRSKFAGLYGFACVRFFDSLYVSIHSPDGDFAGGDGGFCSVGERDEEGGVGVDGVGVGIGHVVAPDKLDILSDGDAVRGEFLQPGAFFGEQSLLHLIKCANEGSGEAGAVGLPPGECLQTGRHGTDLGRQVDARTVDADADDGIVDLA